MRSVLAAGKAILAGVLVVFPQLTPAAYPERPIRLIISSAVGGSPDIVTRVLAAELVKQMGQQIVIDNRPGAAQTIGTEMVVRATPDGYTIGYANVVTLAINKSLLPRQPAGHLLRDAGAFRRQRDPAARGHLSRCPHRRPFLRFGPVHQHALPTGSRDAPENHGGRRRLRGAL